MLIRVAILLQALLWASAHSAGPDVPPASGASVLDGRWHLGDRSLLVAEFEGPAASYAETALANLDRNERRFGGDALRIRYSLDLGKWYAKARYGRTDDTIRTGSEFDQVLGSDRTEVIVGRSFSGGSSRF